jgi:MFS family permease
MHAVAARPILFIVIAQLFGTSLWFSPNSAAASLMAHWALSTAELGELTSATQIGFIMGTLLLATSGLADRFAASRIFAVSCLAGAFFNALFALAATGLEQGLVLRFLVGVTLAGIYPVGMKLVISWSPQNTGATLARPARSVIPGPGRRAGRDGRGGGSRAARAR